MKVIFQLKGESIILEMDLTSVPNTGDHVAFSDKGWSGFVKVKSIIFKNDCIDRIIINLQKE